MTEDERIAIIRTHTENGLSCAKIAPYAECSGAKVNVIQRACGMERPLREDLDMPTRAELLACSGMTTAEICQKYKRGNDAIMKWFKRYDITRIHCGPRVGGLIDLRQIRALAAEGLCAAHIAEKMGFAPTTIMKTSRKEGIELPVGDTNETSRKRPEREEFALAYKKFTSVELASLYGVTEGAISKWVLHFGMRLAGPRRCARQRLKHRSDCSRPIAGCCSAGAIQRALDKVGAR